MTSTAVLIIFYILLFAFIGGLWLWFGYQAAVKAAIKALMGRLPRWTIRLPRWFRSRK